MLSSDFDMYYRDTYIGIRMGGIIKPFYINSVDWQGEDLEQDDHGRYVDEEAAYGIEAYDNLVFHGRVVDSADGHTSSITVRGYNDPRLVFDNPDLGFVEISGRLVWMSYAPQRSVKKGLANRRISHSLTNEVAWSIWDANNNSRLHPDLAKINNNLWYKLVCVAVYTDAGVVLDRDALYLKPLIEEVLECPVLLSES